MTRNALGLPLEAACRAVAGARVVGFADELTPLAPQIASAKILFETLTSPAVWHPRARPPSFSVCRAAFDLPTCC
jgi:hypothetical protein